MPAYQKSPIPGNRWLPHPLMTLVLVIIWLFLVNTITFGHLLLGTLLGIAIPWFTNRFWPERPKIAKPFLLFRFFFITFVTDVIVANITVVRLFLLPDISRLRPRFIEIPLDTQDPMVITILASVISLTPGTVSAEVSEDRQTLIVHGLDVADEALAAQTIKTRYEAPLKEIFSC
ncbi:MAG: Na+/H+ antiporter subunit E [Desulfotignum sp.]|nr:Na+/H+ antiporter subunit E [Desulfotignum sp.]MCF8087585.1 Na+/H+ antiporter subunit E [Desulfotignum sp.]MCF8138152.1 Na+/H+ antiporter subunit E [Desulfotignum sp.]